ncbi:MAG TPA: ParA family protein [Acidobacteriota bacterium]|nr:ParA family protein [Acidobacteriota bacterium]
MGRIITIANQKGGVAKTTTAINLGAALSMSEISVLLVDMDPQGNSTSGLGLDKNTLESGVYNSLLGFVPMADIVRPSSLEWLKVAPSNRDLVGAELEMIDIDRREYRLADALAPLTESFEYILVDCPPSLGLLTVNAMVAADELLIPIQAEYFALEGVSDLLDTVSRVRESLNPGLRIRGVLLTMADDRTNLSQQVSDEVNSYFGDLVFRTVIPRNVRVAEAPSFGLPVMLYDIASKGAKAYLQLAREFLNDGKEKSSR